MTLYVTGLSKCQGELVGRNVSMERIAVSVFSMQEEEEETAASAPNSEDLCRI